MQWQAFLFFYLVAFHDRLGGKVYIFQVKIGNTDHFATACLREIGGKLCSKRQKLILSCLNLPLISHRQALAEHFVLRNSTSF
jgi:hypothetical protein